MSQSPSSEKQHCNDLSGSCLVYFNSICRAQTAKTVKCVQEMDFCEVQENENKQKGVD